MGAPSGLHGGAGCESAAGRDSDVAMDVDDGTPHAEADADPPFASPDVAAPESAYDTPAASHRSASDVAAAALRPSRSRQVCRVRLFGSCKCLSC